MFFIAYIFHTTRHTFCYFLFMFKKYIIELKNNEYGGRNMGTVYAIEKEDLTKIRDYFEKNNQIIMLGILNIGINVALRYSDLSSIKFEDISKNNKIILKEKKTGKIREIKLNNLCLEQIVMLKNYYENKGIEARGYLFKSMCRKYIKNGIDKPITIQSVNRYFKEVQKNLKLDYELGSHSLRKTWGYYYYEQTQDLALIMKILNHSSEKITLKYIGITQERIDTVFENFII